jgi:hypothetical protein
LYRVKRSPGINDSTFVLGHLSTRYK